MKMSLNCYVRVLYQCLLSQWENFKLLDLPYLVFILKFEPFWPWLLEKREIPNYKRGAMT